MEICGLPHVPGQNPQYTLKRRLGGRAEKFGVSAGLQTPDRPDRRLVTTGKGEGHPVTCRWRQRGGVEVQLYPCFISAIRETVN